MSESDEARIARLEKEAQIERDRAVERTRHRPRGRRGTADGAAPAAPPKSRQGITPDGSGADSERG